MTDDAPLDLATVPDHASQLTPAQIFAMSPAQARAMEIALEGKYAARLAAEAAGPKSGDKNNPAETSSPTAKGEAAAATPTKEEPPRPTDIEGNAIPLPDTGIVSSVVMDQRRYAEGKAHLEALGFPGQETDLWDMIEGRVPVDAGLQLKAEQKLAAFERDADWRRRFFAGDAEAVKQFHLATGIISAGKLQRVQR